MPGNQPGNMGPRRNLRGTIRKLQQTQCNTFHIYIYGGDIYVNAGADALDANGNINISGGNMEIWGARSGSDGDFVDLDGTMTISGATLFAGGNAGMVNPNNWKNTQNKILGQYSVNANGIVKIVSGNNVIKSYTAPKNIGYLYYTSPNADSTYQFSIDSSSGNTNPGQGQGQMPGQGMPGFNGSMPGMPPDQGQGMPGFNGTMPGMPGSNNNGTMPGIPPDQGQTNNGTNPGQNPGSSGEEQPTQGQGNATKDDDTYDVYTTADGTIMKYNSIYLIMAVFAFLTL